MKILSLDISTSIIGYSIFDDAKLLRVGHIDMTKLEKDPFKKLDFATSILSKVIEQEKIEKMIAEAALQKFTGGKSSAATMALLQCFNFALSYAVRNLHVDVSHVSFAHARKLTGIPFVKHSSSADKKELIRQYCERKYPFLEWPKKKTGTYKQYCYDISDSIIIGETALQSSSENKAGEASIPKGKRKQTVIKE